MGHAAEAAREGEQMINTQQQLSRRKQAHRLEDDFRILLLSLTEYIAQIPTSFTEQVKNNEIKLYQDIPHGITMFKGNYSTQFMSLRHLSQDSTAFVLPFVIMVL